MNTQQIENKSSFIKILWLGWEFAASKFKYIVLETEWQLENNIIIYKWTVYWICELKSNENYPAQSELK